MLKSLVAGALIGFTETVPAGSIRRPRPLRAVWIDDRDLPDPLSQLPIMLLDPVPIDRAAADERRGIAGSLRLTLASPYRLLQRLRGRLHPD